MAAANFSNTGQTKNIDFSKKWDLSDAIVKTPDSDDPLYVNKAILAIHSPFFKALFFSSFLEAETSEAFVEIEYETLFEILQILHLFNRYGDKQNNLYTPDTLVRLYTASDKYDIPIIRDICEDQLARMIPKNALLVLHELGLHERKSEVIERLSLEQAKDFLDQKYSGLWFSFNDFKLLHTKLVELEKQRKRRACQCNPTVDPLNRLWPRNPVPTHPAPCVQCSRIVYGFNNPRMVFQGPR